MSQPAIALPVELLAALAKWTADPAEPRWGHHLRHLSQVVVRGDHLVACDGRRLAIVPHRGKPQVFGVWRVDIDKVVALAAAVKAPTVELLRTKDRIQVTISPGLTLDVRDSDVAAFPSQEALDKLLVTNVLTGSGSLTAVKLDPVIFSGMSEVENALQSTAEVGFRHVTLTACGGPRDGLVFVGHTGAKYMLMPVAGAL